MPYNTGTLYVVQCGVFLTVQAALYCIHNNISVLLTMQAALCSINNRSVIYYTYSTGNCTVYMNYTLTSVECNKARECGVVSEAFPITNRLRQSGAGPLSMCWQRLLSRSLVSCAVCLHAKGHRWHSYFLLPALPRPQTGHRITGYNRQAL